MITFLTEDEEDRAPFLERAVLHFNMLDEKKAKENKVKEAAMAVKGMEYMTETIRYISPDKARFSILPTACQGAALSLLSTACQSSARRCSMPCRFLHFHCFYSLPK